MAAWLKILLLLIQYGPAILHLVAEILDLISKFGDDKPALKSELKVAVKTYRKSKDKIALYQLRNRLKGQVGARQNTV